MEEDDRIEKDVGSAGLVGIIFGGIIVGLILIILSYKIYGWYEDSRARNLSSGYQYGYQDYFGYPSSKFQD